MIESVVAYLVDPKSRRLLERLHKLNVSRAQPKHMVVDGPLSGKSFCVTGVLSKKREDVHELIRQAGGTVHDKVKQGTSYLLIGEKVGKAKTDAAKKVGATVITEAQFDALRSASDVTPKK
jgi:DNA ligase (NAD+)